MIFMTFSFTELKIFSKNLFVDSFYKKEKEKKKESTKWNCKIP